MKMQMELYGDSWAMTRYDVLRGSWKAVFSSRSYLQSDDLSLLKIVVDFCISEWGAYHKSFCPQLSSAPFAFWGRNYFLAWPNNAYKFSHGTKCDVHCNFGTHGEGRNLIVILVPTLKYSDFDNFDLLSLIVFVKRVHKHKDFFKIKMDNCLLTSIKV